MSSTRGAFTEPPIPVGTEPLSLAERWAECGKGMEQAQLAFRYEATIHAVRAEEQQKFKNFLFALGRVGKVGSLRDALDATEDTP